MNGKVKSFPDGGKLFGPISLALERQRLAPDSQTTPSSASFRAKSNASKETGCRHLTTDGARSPNADPKHRIKELEFSV
jgi:hypothetical protein